MSAVMVNCVACKRDGRSEVRVREEYCKRERSQVVKHVSSGRREKVLRLILKAPVPETDAGGRGENPETDGRTLVKELGKMTP